MPVITRSPEIAWRWRLDPPWATLWGIAGSSRLSPVTRGRRRAPVPGSGVSRGQSLTSLPNRSRGREIDDPDVRRLVDLALLVLIAAAFLVSISGAAGLLRPVVVLAAALTAPGAAIVARLHLGQLAYAVAITIGISLSVDVLSSLAMVWLPWWHPVVVAAAIGALSVFLLARDFVGRTLDALALERQ
jgi:hypothetical protein